jgi:hypothetical protein
MDEGAGRRRGPRFDIPYMTDDLSIPQPIRSVSLARLPLPPIRPIRHSQAVSVMRMSHDLGKGSLTLRIWGETCGFA